MPDLFADPILAYRRFVESRLLDFAVEIGTRIPSEAELDRLYAALLHEQEATDYRTTGGTPEIVCLISILQAEEERAGPMGSVLSEENDHDRRLYEIFLRRLIQRHRKVVQEWIDNITQERPKLELLLLYVANQYASSQRFSDRIIADFRWWQNIEDSGVTPPRWIHWDMPTGTLVDGERYFSAERVIGKAAATLTIQVQTLPGNKIRVTTNLTGSQDVPVRTQFLLEEDSCTLKGYVRGIKIGSSTCMLTGKRVAEIHVWSREPQN